MSSTNHTTHYNLPQFLPQDKPSWQGDINGAMDKIDTAIYDVSLDATSAAEGVDAAMTAANAAQEAANTADTKASAANTAAQLAQEAATAAQTLANTANTNASDAKSEADSAVDSVNSLSSIVAQHSTVISDLSTSIEKVQTQANNNQNNINRATFTKKYYNSDKIGNNTVVGTISYNNTTCMGMLSIVSTTNIASGNVFFTESLLSGIGPTANCSAVAYYVSSNSIRPVDIGVNLTSNGVLNLISSTSIGSGQTIRVEFIL